MSSSPLSVRINPENADHHLWNNHGTWWLHYTLHLPDFTTRRIRKNLRTRDLGRARVLRDELLAALEARHVPDGPGPVPGLQGHDPVPGKGDAVKMHLLKNKKAKSYEPLLPNGIEITKKAKKTK